MKKFFMLFVTIYKWFIGLFKRSKGLKEVKVTPVKKTMFEKSDKRNPFHTPPHNNRKNTRGRFTQHIKQKDGSTRAIYHEAGTTKKPSLSDLI